MAVGIDIIELKRIKKIINKHGQIFLDKILTKDEKNNLKSIKNKLQRIGGRFSAKEAIVKSLNTGISKHISWLDISIYNNKKGCPKVKFSKKAKKFLNKKGIKQVYISISHCDKYAIAMAKVKKIK